MLLSAILKEIVPTAKEILPAADTAAIDKVTGVLTKFSGMSVEHIITTVSKGAVELVLRILAAILVYIIARWIIKRIVKVVTNILINRKIEVSLRGFLVSLTKFGLYIILIFSIIGILGINTTSFLALFASAGLAIGMALSGTLQNFAGGMMILFLEPYKVGHFIETQGYTGIVKEISLFNTLINTVDNKMIIIPNGQLATGIINNYSKETNRRVDWTFGIAYGDDYDKAKELIIKLLADDERIVREPHDVFVALHDLGDSSVNLTVRAWADNEHYWDLYFELNEKVYKEFPKAGISIPFPQMDIHISK